MGASTKRGFYQPVGTDNVNVITDITNNMGRLETILDRDKVINIVATTSSGSSTFEATLSDTYSLTGNDNCSISFSTSNSTSSDNIELIDPNGNSLGTFNLKSGTSKNVSVGEVVANTTYNARISSSALEINLNNSENTIANPISGLSGDNVQELLESLKTYIDATVNICPYDIGDYYITENVVSPSSRWAGTTWTSLDGRVLLSETTTDQIGDQGGYSSVTLSTSHMPSHRHLVNSHNHSISINNDSHNHTRGSMEISGNLYGIAGNSVSTFGGDGAFAQGTINRYTGLDGGSDEGGSLTFRASRNWSGVTSTDTHNHSGSAGNSAPYTNYQGSGNAFSIQNPYRKVYMWRRTA